MKTTATSGSDASASIDACTFGIAKRLANARAPSSVRDVTAQSRASGTSCRPRAKFVAAEPVPHSPHRIGAFKWRELLAACRAARRRADYAEPRVAAKERAPGWLLATLSLAGTIQR